MNKTKVQMYFMMMWVFFFLSVALGRIWMDFYYYGP